MQECQKLIIISTLIALTFCHPLPEDEKVAIYVPYGVKYLPIEVPESLLNVDPLNSTTNHLEPIVLRKQDVLSHLDGVEPLKPLDHVDPKEDLIVIPLGSSSTTQVPPKDDLLAAASTHRLVKRQAQRFPGFRPVVRFSRFSSSRRRFNNRDRAMVGYLSDRDLFPTVA